MTLGQKHTQTSSQAALPAPFFEYMTVSCFSITYLVSGQKLKADTDWQYQYDNRGNLVRKLSNASNPRVEWRYHWDGSDRLRKAVFSNETTNTTLKVVEYYYDVLGRRAAKSIDGNADGAPDAVTKYAYDGDDILYEFDGSNALKARHTHGPGTDDPLYTQTGAAQYFYYHKDGMGSVREITNGAGEVAHRNDYDSFGNIVSVNGCPTAPEYPAAPGAACDGAGDGDAAFAPAHEFYFTYAYTGRQWDAETSLYYYRARYYDPHIGRFISEDPQWSPNLYAYVSNNPMKYTDPSGSFLKFLFGGFAGWWKDFVDIATTTERGNIIHIQTRFIEYISGVITLSDFRCAFAIAFYRIQYALFMLADPARSERQWKPEILYLGHRIKVIFTPIIEDVPDALDFKIEPKLPEYKPFDIRTPSSSSSPRS